MPPRYSREITRPVVLGASLKEQFRTSPCEASCPAGNSIQKMQSLVEKGELSAGHARAVLSLPTPARQRAAAQKILTLRLSVRQAEAMCKRLAAEEKKPEPAKRPAVNYIAECEKALTRRLDRKVRIVSGKRKGRFELEFYGEEDLQRLYEALLALDPSEETHGK